MPPLHGKRLDVLKYHRVYKMFGVENAIVAECSLEESGVVMGVREIGTSST